MYDAEGKRRDGWWSRKAVSLDGNGHLVHRNQEGGRQILDACITTRGKFEHVSAIYVARIQLQKQPGHWPGFWIMRAGDVEGRQQGPGRRRNRHHGEAVAGRPRPTQPPLGRLRQGPQDEGPVVSVPGVMDGFHTFAVWWKPDEYVFYVDGKETWRHQRGRRLPGAAIHPAERRNRHVPGNIRQGQAARPLRWWITCACTIWWTR